MADHKHQKPGSSSPGLLVSAAPAPAAPRSARVKPKPAPGLETDSACSWSGAKHDTERGRGAKKEEKVMTNSMMFTYKSAAF